MTQDDLLQRFIDSAEVAMYLKDDQGRFLMVNRRCAEMFKASKEEVIGKHDYEFVAKEIADQLRKYDRQVAETGTAMTFKITFTLPDGPHTILDHKFPVSGIEGSPNAVGGIGMDMVTTTE